MTTLLMAVVLQTTVGAGTGEKTYAEAYYQSAQTGRPLVVLLGAQWCPACVKLKTSVMPQVAENGGLAGVELAYVDIDKEPALARQLVKGTSIPQLVRFDRGPKGWQSRHMIGAQSPAKVAQFLAGSETKLTDKKAFPVTLGTITRAIGLEH